MMEPNKIGRGKGEPRGQVLVLMCIILVILLAIVGVVMDSGVLSLQRRRMQNAADAAALAGARELYQQQRGGNVSETALLLEVERLAGLNGVAEPSAGAVLAYYTDYDGERLSDAAIPTGSAMLYDEAQGIEVQVSDQLPTTFMCIVGVDTMQAHAGATAVYTQSGDSSGRVAIWGDCMACGQNTVMLTGSSTYVDGDVHSNDSWHISGAHNVVTGRTEYVDSYHLSGASSSVTPVHLAAATPLDELWSTEDFAVGGQFANAAAAADTCGEDSDYHYYDGDVHFSDAQVCLCGLYVAEGDISVSGSSISGRATFVSMEGRIHLSGSYLNLEPYDGLDEVMPLLFSSKSSHSNQAVVQLSGSHITWKGALYGPGGQVMISGSSNTTEAGGIYGRKVQVSGANNRIVGNGSVVPEQLERISLVR